jgi:bleomycin hydrolase
VSEKTNLGGKTGIKYMPQDLETGVVIDQEKRDQMFDSLHTTDDHLMHTTGLATDEDGIFYFYTKDSGGPDRGPFKGFNYISENYFRGKVLAYFVHKDALPEELRAKLGIE